MLSRLLSARTSSLASRSLIQPRLLAAAPSFNRTFKTTPTLQNTAAPVAKADPGPVDIIDKYGATTFWGMVAAIAVSKEMFILDAEFLLSLEIGAFVMTGYVLTGDTINKMSEEWDAKTKEKFDGANDFMVEMFNQYKMVQSTVQHKPAVLKNYAKEYEAAVTAHAAYLTVKPKHDARAQVLAALEQLKAKEEHEIAMAWQHEVDAAVDNVTKAFSAGDAKLTEQSLELAISGLGFSQPTTNEANDPVKRLFMEQFQE